MAKAAEDMEGLDTSNLESMGEDMMAEMMKKFESMGEKVRYDAIDMRNLIRRCTDITIPTERFPGPS